MSKRTLNSTRRRVKGASVAAFVAKAVAVTAALAAVIVLVSPLAGVAAVCGALWVALLVSVRRNRAQSRKIDIYLDETRDTYDSIIGVFCGALYLKDDINAPHSSRVSELCSIVATEMGMRRDEVRLLQKAAILADIGKIEIAQSILAKPGALSDQEWNEMKKHPTTGYNIIASIPNLHDASDIVVSHHERFDGQGYPNGVSGDDIPLGARIFSVVDAYTAMTSDRPHRKKMSHEMAVKEILRNSLTQFDPEVVRAFVRCEERGDIVPLDSIVPADAPLEASSSVAAEKAIAV